MVGGVCSNRRGLPWLTNGSFDTVNRWARHSLQAQVLSHRNATEASIPCAEGDFGSANQPQRICGITGRT